jgi:hypothetical protein
LATNEERVGHWGTYRDDLVSIDSVWYIQRRVVSIDVTDSGGWIGSGVALVKSERQ